MGELRQLAMPPRTMACMAAALTPPSCRLCRVGSNPDECSYVQLDAYRDYLWVFSTREGDVYGSGSCIRSVGEDRASKWFGEYPKCSSQACMFTNGQSPSGEIVSQKRDAISDEMIEAIRKKELESNVALGLGVQLTFEPDRVNFLTLSRGGKLEDKGAGHPVSTIAGSESGDKKCPGLPPPDCPPFDPQLVHARSAEVDVVAQWRQQLKHLTLGYVNPPPAPPPNAPPPLPPVANAVKYVPANACDGPCPDSASQNLKSIFESEEMKGAATNVASGVRRVAALRQSPPVPLKLPAGSDDAPHEAGEASAARDAPRQHALRPTHEAWAKFRLALERKKEHEGRYARQQRREAEWRRIAEAQSRGRPWVSTRASPEEM